MTPQFVDLNGDGHQDLIAATFEGTAFIVEGSDKGWKAPKHIVDENDTNVRIDFFWDLDENDYKNVDRSTDDYDSVEGDHMTSIALVDWDDDGDQDLILGAYEGRLYLCSNIGTATEPKFSATNDRLMAGGKHAAIEGGLATPRIVDWDGDGLFDILCGGSKGGVYWFRNQGKVGAPQFAESKTLIGKMTGQVDNASETGDEGMNAYLDSMMVPSRDGLPTCPGTSMHIEAIDYDGDGDLDLLVGAQSYFQQDKKQLSEEEQEELAKLRKQMQEVQEEMSKLFDEADKDDMQAMQESKEYRAVAEKMAELYPRLEELQPSMEPANFIWLYRNKTRSAEDSSASEPESKSEENSKSSNHEFDPNEFAVHASFSPERVAGGDQVTLTVQIHVPEGFHIYGSQNSIEPTTLTIDDAGLLDVGDPAEIPKGRMIVDAGKPAWWLEGVITIEQKMTVPDDFTKTTVDGSIGYMICNEQGCRPPATEKFSATLKGATK